MTQQIENQDAKKMTVKELEAMVLALTKRVEELEKSATSRRGPKSTREMTEDDARRLIKGDLKDKSHKDAAAILGLSYGQVYSARGGYTFKNILEEK